MTDLERKMAENIAHNDFAGDGPDSWVWSDSLADGPNGQGDTMTSKHTPGPWKVVPSNGRLPGVWRIKSDNPRIRRRAVARTDEDPIGANAALIAAAPDLLEAARRAVAHEDGASRSSGDHHGEVPWRVFDALRAAIAKAEGAA